MYCSLCTFCPGCLFVLPCGGLWRTPEQELEFTTSPAICIESLISINKKVGQPEAAMGILTYAQNELGSAVSVKEDWLSKLGHWEVGAT